MALSFSHPPCWQVCGYRMRLHFDGYSECHDFWLNADSPDIHPAGWFEETGHKLQPPKGKELASLSYWLLLEEGGTKSSSPNTPLEMGPGEPWPHHPLPAPCELVLCFLFLRGCRL